MAAYQVWKDAHINSWLIEAKQYYEDRRLREEAQEAERQAREAMLKARELAQEQARALASVRAAERHKLHLERLGKPYLGTRAAMCAPLHRVTHCYACKGKLDNAIDVECVACGWILCSCGACGCGYSA
jgi:hypothetical protein